ncbi:11269_t:CDS:1 [Paraglomus occultum]|uniref:11269_t:CDS:1 n=1 Tax=Paraglomus occultum TaxID=144539 RepID=A0A9N9GJV9_9GLOM|nr:11269_t:CDS:1 [Paraglomus occultum]
MKSVTVPLVEQQVSCCDCCEPTHAFEAEWCLDLHGYLNRTEFADRLRGINNYIKDYPLLSAKTKTYLTYAIAGLFTLILAVVLIITFAASPGDNIANTAIVTIVVEFLLALAIPIGRSIVDAMAKRRAEIFTRALQPVLDQYNRQENPTANWKIVWRAVFTYFSIDVDSKGKGTATPKYAEHAELVIEINDALSDLTAQTVRVNLTPTAVPIVSTAVPTVSTAVPRMSTINTTYPSQMIGVP